MANDQQFCLRWNNHQSTLISVFDSLLENGTLVDCTLAAEGQYLKAHKVVLSACSPYLEALLSQHFEKHPIVILKDVKFSELKSMMDYMYRGEVNISQDQLGTFLKAAESLQIKGLSDNGDDARDVGSTAKKPDAPRPSVTQTRASIESKRPAPLGDLSDTSRDGSISPSSLRKRRRTRRPSQGDDPDSNLDNNVCDLPAAQSTPMPVPSAAPVQSLPKQIVKTEPPPPMPDPVKKEILDPPAEPLLEPKTEYLDYMNNENSIEVEDLTLDDDDEEGMDSSMDASRPGPSHGDLSQQGGYPPWTMTDQSGTDEIFMAAQEAVGAATGQQQRDSQDPEVVTGFEQVSVDTLRDENYIVYFQCSDCTLLFTTEESHIKHICSAKSCTIPLVGKPITLTPEKFKSIKPEEEDASTVSLEKENEPTDLIKIECEKENIFNGASLGNDGQEATQFEAILIYICSKCKLAFKELSLYNKHPCEVKKLKDNREEKLTSNDDDRKPVDEDREILFQCPQCEAIFMNMFAFKEHPCIKGILDPLEGPGPENLMEVAVENGGLSETDLGCPTDDITFKEEIDHSTIDSPAVHPDSSVIDTEEELSLTDQSMSRKSKRGKNQTPTPFRCSVCHKYFRARYYLIHHSCEPPSKNPLPRGALGKPPYKCPRCGSSYKHKQSFCRHIHHECKMNKRPEKIIPPIRSKKSDTPETPKEHQCPVCNKYFARKYYLIHHACDPPSKNPLPRGALGKPPYLCSGCGMVYKYKQSYCRHIHHECGKGEKKESTFGKRKGKKTAPQNHVCALCNTEFRDQDALEVHVQVDHLSL